MSDANALANAAVGGWRIAGTVVAQSGTPFTVVNNTNQNSFITGCQVGGTATGGDVNNGCNWFPNVVSKPGSGGCTPTSAGGNGGSGPTGTTNCWFNTSAFVNASPGGAFAFGDEGRNSLRGPRLTVFNFSLAKDFSFGERIRLELRSDWVNIFNHPSFNTPGQSLGGANFGQINNATLGNGVTVAPRSGQLSAKVTF
jgi:hypothetical protein